MLTRLSLIESRLLLYSDDCLWDLPVECFYLNILKAESEKGRGWLRETRVWVTILT